ncbi:ABC transporter permease [Clostridium estertheticum]|uniref:ABC transporter permease n=1 Tax=Clostridium estertheticum TaxID=238834 RepID=UPI00147869AF|nr:ABC transporter permease [Clostridium estertheticum]MBZ9618260.1 ABC transporter permease [Clostridium estertheticum subsp. laramiense]WAG76238.1 ABC transporter permease [Clostridium estertheticum]
MFNIIAATYKKNRSVAKRAFPWTLIIGRFIAGFFTILFPYFIYTFFLKGTLSENFNKYTNQSDYITYIVLGSAFFILGRSIMMEVGRAMILELREGTLEPFLLSSASRMGYFIGCLAEQLGRGVLQLSVILLLGGIFGAHIIGIFSLQSIIIIALAILGFFSMALILSCIMLYTKDTYITQNTLFTFMGFVSGVSFPVEYLPTWLQYLSYLFPMTAALKLFRLIVISNQSILLHMDLVLELLILSLAYILIGILCFNKIEKKLTENIFG